MMKTKILSALLCGAFAFSLSGCGRGSSVSPAELFWYVDNGETKVYDDASDFTDYLALFRNPNDTDRIGRGGVITLDNSKDIKKVMSDKNISYLPIIDDFYSKDMTEVTVFCSGVIKGDAGHLEYAFAFTFEDKDSAASYFKKLHEGIQPKNPTYQANNDSGTEGGIEYSVMNIIDGENSAGVGVYLDGEDLMLIYSYGYKDSSSLKAADTFCEDLGLHLVTDT